MASSRPTINNERSKKTKALQALQQKHRKKISAKDYSQEQALSIIRDTLKFYGNGDFSVRIPEFKDGIVSEIALMLNTVIERNDATAKEFMRVSTVVANEGRLSERAYVEGVNGAWAYKINALNSIIGALVRLPQKFAEPEVNNGFQEKYKRTNPEATQLTNLSG